MFSLGLARARRITRAEHLDDSDVRPCLYPTDTYIAQYIYKDEATASVATNDARSAPSPISLQLPHLFNHQHRPNCAKGNNAVGPCRMRIPYTSAISATKRILARRRIRLRLQLVRSRHRLRGHRTRPRRRRARLPSPHHERIDFGPTRRGSYKKIQAKLKQTVHASR